jgi:hypothetical protein
MMASSFPSSIDAFPDPLANSPLDSPSHSGLHQDVNDAVEKIETKVGLGSSPASGASAGQVLKSSGGGSTGWSDIVVGDIDATGQAANNVIVADGAGNAAWSGAAGLWLVKTQTIGTGVSSVTVTDAFNATYDNYKITVSNGVGSADTYFRLHLGSTTSGYKYVYTHFGYGGGSPYYESSASASSFIYCGVVNPSECFTDLDLESPFLAKPTRFRRTFANNGVSGWTNGYLPNTTQYTAFTLTPASGTMTGGTIRVYGYRN